jgi:hypothetical protein
MAQTARAGGCIHAGGRDAISQIGEAERDAGTGARAEVPESHDAEVILDHRHVANVARPGIWACASL